MVCRGSVCGKNEPGEFHMPSARPPENTLTAVVALLSPYCPGLCRDDLLRAIETCRGSSAGKRNTGRRWLSVDEARAYLGGIAKSSLHRYRRVGIPAPDGVRVKLPCHKIAGRTLFDRDELDQFVLSTSSAQRRRDGVAVSR